MTQESLNNTHNASATAPEMAMAETARRRALAHLIARAWADEQFKQRLFQQPEEVFAEYNLELPAGKKIHVVQDSASVKDEAEVYNFVLPARPEELGHMALERLNAEFSEDPDDDYRHCGGCGGCGHCRHCGGCGGCGHCRHSGGCGGCGGCRGCGHCRHDDE